MSEQEGGPDFAPYSFEGAFVDAYSELGVPHTASDKKIQGAFRKKSREFHPDLNPNDREAERSFQRMNLAYEALGQGGKNKGNREKYDRVRDQYDRFRKGQEKVQENGGVFSFGGKKVSNPESTSFEDFLGMFYQPSGPDPEIIVTPKAPSEGGATHSQQQAWAKSLRRKPKPGPVYPPDQPDPAMEAMKEWARPRTEKTPNQLAEEMQREDLRELGNLANGCAVLIKRGGKIAVVVTVGIIGLNVALSEIQRVGGNIGYEPAGLGDSQTTQVQEAPLEERMNPDNYPGYNLNLRSEMEEALENLGAFPNGENRNIWIWPQQNDRVELFLLPTSSRQNLEQRLTDLGVSYDSNRTAWTRLGESAQAPSFSYSQEELSDGLRQVINQQPSQASQ